MIRRLILTENSYFLVYFYELIRFFVHVSFLIVFKYIVQSQQMKKKNRRIFILIAFHLQKQSQHHRLKEMKETQQQYRLIRVHRPHQMMRKERQAIQLATQRAIGKSHLVHQVIQFYCHLLFD